MARVYTSKFQARPGTKLPGVKTLPDGTVGMRCQGPGDEHYIRKGDKYLSFAPGFRAPLRVRCMQHPPRPSELDSSLMSQVLAAQEDAIANLAAIDLSQDPDDTKQAVNDEIENVRSAVEDVVQAYNDADEAMGGHQGQQAEWASNLTDAKVMSWDAGDHDDFDEPDDIHEPDDDGSPVGDLGPHSVSEGIDAGCDECQGTRDDAVREWAQGLIDAASEVINDISKD